MRVGNENCDDGSDDDIGCKEGCKSGAYEQWNCNNPADKTLITTCINICGDGKLVSPEFCDAGPGKPGCSDDCLSVLPTHSCSGGDRNQPTICEELPTEENLEKTN